MKVDRDQELHLQRAKESDEQWTAPKLLAVTVLTLCAAFTVIYIISSMSPGTQVSPLHY